MPRRIRIGLAVLLVAVAGLIAWQLLRQQVQAEPVYQGKTLSVWLADPVFTWDTQRDTPATEAVRQIGTNALPFLIQDLQSKDGPLRRQLYRLNVKLLKGKLKFLGPSAGIRHLRAVNALRLLGPRAKPAIPALSQCLERDDIAWEAASILGYYDSSGYPLLGPEATGPLLSALTNRNLEVRRIAANSLGLMQTRPEVVVPALIRTLADPAAEVRAMAASSFGGIYKQQADTVVPALIKMLEDTDPVVRRKTAWMLGRYGARARAGVPRLVSLLNDLDPEVQQESAKALKLIDPEAATQAGIK